MTRSLYFSLTSASKLPNGGSFDVNLTNDQASPQSGVDVVSDEDVSTPTNEERAGLVNNEDVSLLADRPGINPESGAPGSQPSGKFILHSMHIASIFGSGTWQKLGMAKQH